VGGGEHTGIGVSGEASATTWEHYKNHFRSWA